MYSKNKFVGGAMPEMPRMNKRLLFNAVQADTRSENVQTGLFGPIKRRHHRPKREELFESALRKANLLAHNYAVQRWEKSGHRSSIEKAEKLAFARQLAAVYTWPELFDGRRGFVSVKDAYRRKSVYRNTGRPEYYKGVDSALYGLLAKADVNLTAPQVAQLTRELLLNHTDEIKDLEINKEFPATTACQFYARSIEPRLGLMLPNEVLGEEERVARLDHHLIFILYVAMRRELAERQIQVYRDAIRAEREESARLKTLDRRDIREETEKGVPLDQLLDAVRRPEPSNKESKGKQVNRF